MRAFDKYRIFLVPSIIHFRDKIDDFCFSAELSDDAVTIGVLRIFVDSIILVLILSPSVAVGKSNRLLVVR